MKRQPISVQRPAVRRLVTATSAVLAGGILLSSAAQAGGEAPMPYLADNEGLGDTALFQYYTAKNNWKTFFRLINTSDKAIVVKVRFREAANSREVLDFEVALSPEDMWSGWTTENALGADTGPGIKTTDNSCIFPSPDNGGDEGFQTQPDGSLAALFKERAFTGPYYDNGPFPDDPDARMAEGHFEVIGVAAYDPASDFARAVTHRQSGPGFGFPNDCGEAENLFNNQFVDDDYDVPNALAANAYLINTATGQGAGYDPNIIANCADTSLRSITLLTDTSPDLDDCTPGGFGDPASIVGGIPTFAPNSTIAVNQRLWNGEDVPDVVTTRYVADILPWRGNNSGDLPGNLSLDGTFNFDSNKDGDCNDPGEQNIAERDVPLAVYEAAAQDEIKLLRTAGNCFQELNSSTKQGPATTAVQQDFAPNGWRIKQKGVAGEYHVSGGVDAISSLFMADSVINEWAASNTGGAISAYYTQWILTFPTKNYYVDLQDDPILSANLFGEDISPTLARTTQPTDESFAPFGGLPLGTSIFEDQGSSCEPVKVEMWNREESPVSYTSPAPTPENELCWETNVVAFTDPDNASVFEGLGSDFAMLIDPLSKPIDAGGKPSDRGWARMTFIGEGAQTGLLVPADLNGSWNYAKCQAQSLVATDTVIECEKPRLRTDTGLPVTGFMFSVYETGDRATAHATINAHKYEREPVGDMVDIR
jgi:hypothetical protein